MIIVTSEEIAQLRSELSAYADALEALDVIEDCEGDIEDAALVLAIQAGQEPDRGDDWLAGVAKRYRPAICEKEFRDDLLNGRLATVVGYLLEKRLCPARLVTPVAIYALKQGVNNFCDPLELKI